MPTTTTEGPTMNDDPSASAPSASGASARGTRSVVTILLVAAFVVILNETTMNVALTSIMEDLGIQERTAQWLTTGFMLTMAVVIPTTGWLINRVGTRNAFGAAMTFFSIGTAICLLAPAFPFLLAGRVIQAMGTAIMMPLLMTTIMQVVDPKHRGSMMGTVSMVISVAPAVGPTLSGILLQLGTWHYIFATVLPIALLMLVLGMRRLTDVSERQADPLDVLSLALTVVGFGGLVYGLSLVGADGVPAAQPITAFAIGAVGLAAFVARQLVLQRTDSALLDLRTFRFGTFTVALTMMGIAMMALFGTIIMLPLLLQRAYGMEPVQVGLLMLPGGVLMGVLGPVVGRLYDRVGPRPLVIPATLVVAGAFLAFATLSPATPWWFVLACHVAMSVSFAFVFTPLFTVSLGSLPRPLYSHGSALVGTIQQVAGAAGTAVFVTVFAMQTANASAAGAADDVALLTGSHAAFLGAGAVWALVIVASFFLRRPAEDPDDSDAPAGLH